jgi:hypothetical protein
MATTTGRTLHGDTMAVDIKQTNMTSDYRQHTKNTGKSISDESQNPNYLYSHLYSFCYLLGMQ